MAKIIKSGKDVWYNRDDTLDRIGSNLTGTPGQEYTYTVGHTSSGKFKLRCNHMDEPRCGQIRLPNTDKKLRALESEIITEINSYRRKFGIAYLVKWNNFTKPQKDIGILRYAFEALNRMVQLGLVS